MILKSDIFPKEVYTILDMTYDRSLDRGRGDADGQGDDTKTPQEAWRGQTKQVLNFILVITCMLCYQIFHYIDKPLLSHFFTQQKVLSIKKRNDSVESFFMYFNKVVAFSPQTFYKSFYWI